MIEAHKLLLCLAESLRFEPPGLSSLSATHATQTHAHERAARTCARTHAHALAAAACCAAIQRTTTHEGAAGVVLSRRYCALMDAIRSAAGAGAAGSVLRRSRRRRRRTDQPRRVHRSCQEGAALLAARQGRSHSPSPSMTLAQFMAAAEAYEFFYHKCVPYRQYRDVPRRTYRSGRLQPPSPILCATARRGPPAEGSQAALLYGGAGWRCRSTRTRATRSARRSSR
jgi:hypothetical protein